MHGVWFLDMTRFIFTSTSFLDCMVFENGLGLSHNRVSTRDTKNILGLSGNVGLPIEDYTGISLARVDSKL